jgi:hypothetical protein
MAWYWLFLVGGAVWWLGGCAVWAADQAKKPKERWLASILWPLFCLIIIGIIAAYACAVVPTRFMVKLFERLIHGQPASQAA